MEPKRFKKKNGPFRIKAYALSLTLIGICIVIFFIGFFIDKSIKNIMLSAALLPCFLLFVYTLILPHMEEYHLEYPLLYVKKGKKITERRLPEQYSLILSEMAVAGIIDSIHPVWIIGQCYVSIIDSMDQQQILDILHAGRRTYSTELTFGKRLDSASVERKFQHAFFDGFIYDRTIPDILFENAEALIIPKSILNRIEHPVLLLPNLFVDEKY